MIPERIGGLSKETDLLGLIQVHSIQDSKSELTLCVVDLTTLQCCQKDFGVFTFKDVQLVR